MEPRSGIYEGQQHQRRVLAQQQRQHEQRVIESHDCVGTVAAASSARGVARRAASIYSGVSLQNVCVERGFRRSKGSDEAASTAATARSPAHRAPSRTITSSTALSKNRVCAAAPRATSGSVAAASAASAGEATLAGQHLVSAVHSSTVEVTFPAAEKASEITRAAAPEALQNRRCKVDGLQPDNKFYIHEPLGEVTSCEECAEPERSLPKSISLLDSSLLPASHTFKHHLVTSPVCAAAPPLVSPSAAHSPVVLTGSDGRGSPVIAAASSRACNDATATFAGADSMGARESSSGVSTIRGRPLQRAATSLFVDTSSSSSSNSGWRKSRTALIDSDSLPGSFRSSSSLVLNKASAEDGGSMRFGGAAATASNSAAAARGRRGEAEEGRPKNTVQRETSLAQRFLRHRRDNRASSPPLSVSLRRAETAIFPTVSGLQSRSATATFESVYREVDEEARELAAAGREGGIAETHRQTFWRRAQRRSTGSNSSDGSSRHVGAAAPSKDGSSRTSEFSFVHSGRRERPAETAVAGVAQTLLGQRTFATGSGAIGTPAAPGGRRVFGNGYVGGGESVAVKCVNDRDEEAMAVAANGDDRESKMKTEEAQQPKQQRGLKRGGSGSHKWQSQAGKDEKFTHKNATAEEILAQKRSSGVPAEKESVGLKKSESSVSHVKKKKSSFWWSFAKTNKPRRGSSTGPNDAAASGRSLPRSRSVCSRSSSRIGASTSRSEDTSERSHGSIITNMSLLSGISKQAGCLLTEPSDLDEDYTAACVRGEKAEGLFDKKKAATLGPSRSSGAAAGEAAAQHVRTPAARTAAETRLHGVEAATAPRKEDEAAFATDIGRRGCHTFSQLHKTTGPGSRQQTGLGVQPGIVGTTQQQAWEDSRPNSTSQRGESTYVTAQVGEDIEAKKGVKEKKIRDASPASSTCSRKSLPGRFAKGLAALFVSKKKSKPTTPQAAANAATTTSSKERRGSAPVAAAAAPAAEEGIKEHRRETQEALVMLPTVDACTEVQMLSTQYQTLLLQQLQLMKRQTQQLLVTVEDATKTTPPVHVDHPTSGEAGEQLHKQSWTKRAGGTKAAVGQHLRDEKIEAQLQEEGTRLHLLNLLLCIQRNKQALLSLQSVTGAVHDEQQQHEADCEQLRLWSSKHGDLTFKRDLVAYYYQQVTKASSSTIHEYHRRCVLLNSDVQLLRDRITQIVQRSLLLLSSPPSLASLYNPVGPLSAHCKQGRLYAATSTGASRAAAASAVGEGYSFLSPARKKEASEWLEWLQRFPGMTAAAAGVLQHFATDPRVLRMAPPFLSELRLYTIARIYPRPSSSFAADAADGVSMSGTSAPSSHWRQEEKKEAGDGYDWSRSSTVLLPVSSASALSERACVRSIPSGLLLRSSAADLERVEQQLEGKWGSYKLYESWVSDAMRWQWRDAVNMRQHCRSRKQLLEWRQKLRRRMQRAIDLRLKQLWFGRMHALHADMLQQYRDKIAAVLLFPLYEKEETEGAATLSQGPQQPMKMKGRKVRTPDYLDAQQERHGKEEALTYKRSAAAAKTPTTSAAAKGRHTSSRRITAGSDMLLEKKATKVKDTAATAAALYRDATAESPHADEASRPLRLPSSGGRTGLWRPTAAALAARETRVGVRGDGEIPDEGEIAAAYTVVRLETCYRNMEAALLAAEDMREQVLRVTSTTAYASVAAAIKERQKKQEREGHDRHQQIRMQINRVQSLLARMQQQRLQLEVEEDATQQPEILEEECTQAEAAATLLQEELRLLQEKRGIRQQQLLDARVAAQAKLLQIASLFDKEQEGLRTVENDWTAMQQLAKDIEALLVEKGALRMQELADAATHAQQQREATRARLQEALDQLQALKMKSGLRKLQAAAAKKEEHERKKEREAAAAALAAAQRARLIAEKEAAVQKRHAEETARLLQLQLKRSREATATDTRRAERKKA